MWLTARGLSVYEAKVGIFDEKAETREFKLAIGQLLKMGQVSEARQMFYEILKVRPDIRLEHSDLKHEIPLIEQILYICELEMRQGIAGMLQYSKELPELLMHFKQIVALLENDKAWTKEQKDYLQNTFVTDIAVEVIARNDLKLQNNWENVMERWKKRK